jgi:hypothetical protein
MSSEITQVLEVRGSRYGDFREHARITQRIKAAMADSPNWAKLPPYQREALEMIAHKVGRMLNGDPTYEDNLIDILGYGQLALDDTRADNKTEENLASHASKVQKPKR